MSGKQAKKCRGLTTKQHKAIVALLEGTSDKEAAETAGVSRNTIGNWRNDADFNEALVSARADLLKTTTTRLHAAALHAVTALEEVAKDAQHPSARVSAAKSIIEFSQRAFELEELERRVEEIESALSATPAC